MSITHKIDVAFVGGGANAADTVTVAAATEQNVSALIPDNTTNQALNVDWAAGKLQSFYLRVSSDCTLYVNNPSGGGPTDTIQLKAGYPIAWSKLSGVREPFVGTAGAVTNMYITTPNQTPDVAVQVELRAAVDL